MPDVPTVRDTYALGSYVTATGAVTADASGDTFRRGNEVFLSVDVSSASTDQTIVVDWLDSNDRVLRRETQHVEHGARTERHAVFSSGPTQKWTAGAHRAIVVIDGRRVSERTFEMV